MEGLVKRTVKLFSDWYLKYSLFIPVYMLEPTEACVVNALLVALIAMCVYTSYLFLPGHAVMLLNFFRYMLGLTDDEQHSATAHTDTGHTDTV